MGTRRLLGPCVLAISAAACDTALLDVELAPQSFAGFDRTIVVDEWSALDGTGSRSPDAEPLAYRWRLHDGPPGSAAVLLDGDAQVALFRADLPGRYVLALQVVDEGLSDTDLVTLTAIAIDHTSADVPFALSPRTCHADLEELDYSPCGAAGGRVAIAPLVSAAPGADWSVDWQFLAMPPGTSTMDLNPKLVDGPLGPLSFTPVRPGEYWISGRLRGTRVRSPMAIASIAVFAEDAASEDRPRPELSGPAEAAVGERVLLDGRGGNLDPPSPGVTVRRDWSLLFDPSGGTDALEDIATGCRADECRRLVPTVPGLYVVRLSARAGDVTGVTALHAIEVK